MATQTILITGASSGIGRAAAELFGQRGDRLLLVARRQQRLAELQARLAATCGATVDTYQLDVRDRAAVAAWAAAAPLAEVDVLVNAAGLARGLAPLHVGEPDDWDEMLDTNVKGLLYVTRAVVPTMVARGAGHVVNIGSVAGRSTYPNGAVYCASKQAERAITEGLRMDLSGTGVRVTTIDPGMVATEFSAVRFHGDEARAAKVYEGMTPLAASDVAEAIAWVVDRPLHVSVAEIVIYPTDQASPTLVHRRASGQ